MRDIKDIHVKVSFTNNLLRRKIKERYGDIPIYKFAELVGINSTTLSNMLHFHVNPLRRRKLFEWIPTAQRIADCLDCDPGDIFPPEFCQARKSTFELELDSRQYISWSAPEMIAETTGETPEDSYNLKEIIASLPDVLSTLTPREQTVLRFRFGFDGEQLTLEETAKRVHVTKERIRQIEAKALRKLRHPRRRRLVETFEREPLESDSVE